MLKKVSQTTPTMASIVDGYGTSTTDAYSQNYVNSINTYSTSEVDTGKKWIDGSKIYRKVYNFTLASSIPTDNNIGSVPTGISQMISMSGIINDNLNVIPIPISWNNANDCGIITQGNNIIVRSTWDALADKSGFVIIEYTKAN